MKRGIALIIILTLVFCIGCGAPAAPEAPAPVEEETPAQPAVPKLGQVQYEEEEVVAPPAQEEKEEEPAAAKTPEKTTQETPDEPTDSTPIGTRAEGTEHTAVEEYATEDVQEIKLTADKLMSLSELTVKKGTKLAWKNYDTWPHQLAVETGSGWDTVRHAESHRLLEGGVWEYTFEEKGDFLVRDIFSGGMRMTVTVE
ncbi:hypothetical protein KY362_01315 [Candidatus Woesearchaeota archaeon]|nr:hypothetical protein [Candidatus Woesearchaeota archaeon]